MEKSHFVSISLFCGKILIKSSVSPYDEREEDMPMLASHMKIDKKLFSTLI